MIYIVGVLVAVCALVWMIVAVLWTGKKTTEAARYGKRMLDARLAILEKEARKQ